MKFAKTLLLSLAKKFVFAKALALLIKEFVVPALLEWSEDQLLIQQDQSLKQSSSIIVE